MVMMAGIGVLALGLVVMQANRTAKKNAIKTSVDRDIEEVMNVLGTIFNTPISCNLALKGKTYGTTAIPLGNLKMNASDTKNAINVNSFDVFDEGKNTSVIRQNLKITSLKYKLIVPQSTTSTGLRPRTAVVPLPTNYESPNSYPADANYNPAIFNIIVLFSRKVPVAHPDENHAQFVEQEVHKYYIIDVPVVTSTYDDSTKTLTDSPTILGCVKSPASTYPYP